MVAGVVAAAAIAVQERIVAVTAGGGRELTNLDYQKI